MKSIIAFAFVFVISFFLNISSCLADEIGGQLNNNLSKESKSNEINDKADTNEFSNQDIFGDEQAFPFIAGLGKNAAH